MTQCLQQCGDLLRDLDIMIGKQFLNGDIQETQQGHPGSKVGTLDSLGPFSKERACVLGLDGVCYRYRRGPGSSWRAPCHIGT